MNRTSCQEQVYSQRLTGEAAASSFHPLSGSLATTFFPDLTGMSFTNPQVIFVTIVFIISFYFCMAQLSQATHILFQHPSSGGERTQSSTTTICLHMASIIKSTSKTTTLLVVGVLPVTGTSTYNKPLTSQDKPVRLALLLPHYTVEKTEPQRA